MGRIRTTYIYRVIFSNSDGTPTEMFSFSEQGANDFAITYGHGGDYIVEKWTLLADIEDITPVG